MRHSPKWKDSYGQFPNIDPTIRDRLHRFDRLNRSVTSIGFIGCNGSAIAITTPPSIHLNLMDVIAIGIVKMHRGMRDKDRTNGSLRMISSGSSSFATGVPINASS
jgi:hypothetical protein